jgi:alanyl-tRNA synthetase
VGGREGSAASKMFKIIKEESSSAGVRRIKAVLVYIFRGRDKQIEKYRIDER